MDISISEKIRKIRVENGLSQKKLGEYLGISDRAVSKWESGLSKPSVKNLFEISKIFNITTHSLVSLHHFYPGRHLHMLCSSRVQLFFRFGFV